MWVEKVLRFLVIEVFVVFRYGLEVVYVGFLLGFMEFEV